MKVKDLLATIEDSKKKYEDFLDWDVYTEQIDEADKECKRTGIQKDWGKLGDSEEWEYFECCGFWTFFEKEKVFTINVNY